MATAVNPLGLFKHHPSRYRALSIFGFTLICFFASFFLFSQTISVWQSTQAKQFQAESFKIERESVRKEFAKDTLDFSSFMLAAAGVHVSLPQSFSLFPIRALAHFVSHLEVILVREHPPRAPPAAIA